MVFSYMFQIYLVGTIKFHLVVLSIQHIIVLTFIRDLKVNILCVHIIVLIFIRELKVNILCVHVIVYMCARILYIYSITK